MENLEEFFRVNTGLDVIASTMTAIATLRPHHPDPSNGLIDYLPPSAESSLIRHVRTRTGIAYAYNTRFRAAMQSLKREEYLLQFIRRWIGVELRKRYPKFVLPAEFTQEVVVDMPTHQDPQPRPIWETADLWKEGLHV